ncbi:YecR family lipoprotein [Pseudotabrizicola sp.]|uniref:YecR family lipoprotein n=1 Tax=Pseudotabrizicola sp. TaxID=2939647 RepID=UPI002731F1F3|nr:YecR family lipoprotein [Pseudotabrizicola sp.]MDP2081357.1 YecR family lipoprotein [Pseudotabrizicola sp.]
MKNPFLMFVSLLALAACNVPTTIAPVGGSRADGVVVIGSNQPHDAQSLGVAIQTCKGWGYQGAAPFSGVTVHPQNIAGTSVEWRQNYQCTV